MAILLSLQHVSKTFPGVKALQDVSFALERAEVHAICGENGAGKSTLMNILTGHLRPDVGAQIELNGQAVEIQNFAQAKTLGIAMVHQERSLFDELSIADNIFANRQPRHVWGGIDYPRLYAETSQILESLNLIALKPQTLVAELSPAQKQLIELGKALSQKPQLLILDEPTASIGEKETQLLFRIIRELQTQGVTILYISHRMAEIFAIADRVTVLKDGQYQGTLPVAQTNAAELFSRMVGRKETQLLKQNVRTEREVLRLEAASGLGFQNISFRVHAGEVLALAGLIGAGRTEVARAIFGMNPLWSGQIYLHGEPCSFKHPADAIAAGIGYVPEERKSQGLFLDRSVEQNITVGQLATAQVPTFSQQHSAAQAMRETLNIQTPTLHQKIRLLSGGNQQKCVLARWFLLQPKLLLIDEPTHGVDVGAKYEIYQFIQQMTAQGLAVLLISSELPEVLALADRILVLYRGQVAGELSAAEATEGKILSMASGEYSYPGEN
jgi:ribose transport system ATP-binding protein